MINSEITTKCCSDWFGIGNYNIYTGYTIGSANNTYKLIVHGHQFMIDYLPS